MPKHFLLLCFVHHKLQSGADEFATTIAAAEIAESAFDSGHNVCRDCLAAAGPAPAIQNSSTGVLKDHDDSDEAVMLAALDQYESKTGEGVMLC